MNSRCRLPLTEPDDQMNIPHPRIGFHGVVDNNFNFRLLEKMADLRPEFHFIVLGTRTSPTQSNIHFLGIKDEDTLPYYLSGWDCGFIPSLDKVSILVSELLSAGKPVVSTSIPEVIHPYGDAKLVHIADHPEHFVECIENAINESNYDPEWLERVDQFLDENFEEKVVTRVPAYMDSALISIGIA